MRIFLYFADIVWVSFMLYLGTSPSPLGASIAPEGSDSYLGHFGTNVVLAALIYLSASVRTPSIRTRIRTSAIAVGGAISLGTAIEGLQILIPERSAEASDILFNAAGAVTGVSMLFILHLLTRRWHRPALSLSQWFP